MFLDHSNISEDTVPFHMNRCNQKEDKKKNGLDVAFGLLASLLASAMFGSMFIPLKKFNTGYTIKFDHIHNDLKIIL